MFSHPNKLFRWIDDFYPEPDLVREIALRSKYFVPEGLYGLRSTQGYLPRGTIDRMRTGFGFEKVVLAGVSHSSTHFYQCLAQGKQRTHFFAHIDGRCSVKHPLFSMIVYLSRRPPSNSGTGIYRHRQTGVWQEPTVADARRLGQTRRELQARLDSDASHRSRWELVESCENRYNRAVVFPAHWYHSSRRDFGSRLENGRLYQASFFCGYPDVFIA